MVFFAWDDSLKIGITSVDDQHRKLIKLINELYAAMKEGKAAAILEKLVKELGDYTVYHFTEEEKLMQKTNYADFPAHKKEHEDFVQYIKAQKQKIEAGRGGLMSFELANFLKDWLKNHIAGTDMKYGPEMLKAGIK